MKLSGVVISMWMSAALAAGCAGGDDRAVAVEFGDGSATVSVRKVAVEIPAGTAVTIGAEMLSDLPEAYAFEASIASPRQFELRLSNDAGTSHAVKLSATGLEVEFKRGSVTRTESLGFGDAASFDRWLAAHVADGTAACDRLPARFRDLPLEFVSEAIAADLSALHGLALDLPRLRQVMCAQGASGTDDTGIYGLEGYVGWLALQDPEYTGEDFLARVTGAQAAAHDGFKTTCAKETVTIDQYAPVSIVETSPTGNLDMTCTDGEAHVDARCCQDEVYDEHLHGNLRKRGIDSFVACDHVKAANGAATKYAEWRFTGGLTACPTGAGTCSPNGAIDSVTPHHCTLSGYQDASTPGFADIGGPAPDSADGVAAYSMLAFALYVCYEPGASADTIYYHNRTITHFGARLCNGDNLDECHCG